MTVVWFTENNAPHTVEIWPGAQGNARIDSTAFGPIIIQLELEPASNYYSNYRGARSGGLWAPATYRSAGNARIDSTAFGPRIIQLGSWGSPRRARHRAGGPPEGRTRTWRRGARCNPWSRSSSSQHRPMHRPGSTSSSQLPSIDPAFLVHVGDRVNEFRAKQSELDSFTAISVYPFLF